jgi:NAD(P)-dependent dehydrogenase (short-subunit alcohol dehydrogenase family)
MAGEALLESPVYVVLGATGGIGGSLCERLAGDGARLLLGARDGTRLAGLAQRTGGHPFVLDARSPAEVTAAVDEAERRFGRVDGAVNLVGSILLRPAHLTSPEQFRDVIDTNLGTAFHLVRAAVPRLQASRGSLVLVSTAAAQVGLAHHEAVAAAKAGVEALARSAAASYASRGVRVNCVAPGLVETPLSERLLRTPAARSASLALHPLGRLGQPDDVAAAIAWLLDGSVSGWVTGQVIGVDGGLSALRGSARS